MQKNPIQCQAAEHAEPDNASALAGAALRDGMSSSNSKRCCFRATATALLLYLTGADIRVAGAALRAALFRDVVVVDNVSGLKVTGL